MSDHSSVRSSEQAQQPEKLHETGFSVTVPLAWLPLCIFLLSVVGVHLSYAIAVYMEHIPLCIPYWDSCTSISRTGRLLPEKLVFKAFMLPVALLSMVFWWVLGTWMQRLLACGRVLIWLGITANLFVILYLLALGEGGDAYRTLRRTGVTTYFGLTLLAQLLFVYYFQSRLLHVNNAPGVHSLYRKMYWLMLLTFVIGILSVVLSIFYPGYRYIDDAFEWNIALVMNLHFLLHYWLWRELRIRMQLC